MSPRAAEVRGRIEQASTQGYGIRDVERLLGLPRSTVRALVAAGFVIPGRGPRNAWRFSFQDLIVLRTAQALIDAELPRRRINRSLRELRRHLPEAMPLSGLRIAAEGDRVVVREGASRWQADSGQYLLAFEGDAAQGSLGVVAPPPPAAGEDWFEQGVALEARDVASAMAAYERAIAADPRRVEPRLNLGRLLHEARRHADAERVYRDAIRACGGDALLHYNLGVLLEDMRRAPEALAAYVAAVRADPGLADGHYNLSLLYEKLGRLRDALRHMAQYRRLAGRGSG